MNNIRISINLNPATYTGLIRAANMEKRDWHEFVVDVIVAAIAPPVVIEPVPDEKPKKKEKK
jgi:uncharacterized protein (DUF1778 family)